MMLFLGVTLAAKDHWDVIGHMGESVYQIRVKSEKPSRTPLGDVSWSYPKLISNDKMLVMGMLVTMMMI